MTETRDREVSVRQFRGDLAAILNEVSTRGAFVYVTSNGRRVAALVPLDVAEKARPEVQR